MARGTCFYITDNPNDDGSLFDADYLNETHQGSDFEYARDMDEAERQKDTERLMAKFKEFGATVEGNTVTFGDGFRTAFFADRLKKLQELVANMTIKEFAEDEPRDEGEGNRIYPFSVAQDLMCDNYGDAVWFNDGFFEFDTFIRWHAKGDKPFYVRSAVYMK